MAHVSDSSSGRMLDAERQVRFSDEKATVTEISVTKRGSIAVWGVRPGQTVAPHTHPDGQDTWVVIRGELTYLLGIGMRKKISAGSVIVAEESQIHGAVNEGTQDAVFLSIYSAPTLKTIPAIA